MKLTTNGRRELLNDIQMAIACLNDTFVLVNHEQLCKSNHIAAMIEHDANILRAIIECLQDGGYSND